MLTPLVYGTRKGSYGTAQLRGADTLGGSYWLCISSIFVLPRAAELLPAGHGCWPKGLSFREEHVSPGKRLQPRNQSSPLLPSAEPGSSYFSACLPQDARETIQEMGPSRRVSSLQMLWSSTAGNSTDSFSHWLWEGGLPARPQLSRERRGNLLPAVSVSLAKEADIQRGSRDGPRRRLATAP